MASRLGVPSIPSPSLSSSSPYTTRIALGPRESGGRAPGGADAVNERSLSARWRNEAEVSVLWALLRSSPLPPALSPRLNGSLLSPVLAMLHGEKRTGRSGPATDTDDTTDDREELFRVKAGRKPGGGDARGGGDAEAWVSAGPLGLSPMASAVTASCDEPRDAAPAPSEDEAPDIC
eukprot:scaffold1493_cov66-Phaeocystis_antarctica.AAC.3